MVAFFLYCAGERTRSQIFYSSALVKFRDPGSLFCFTKQNMLRPSSPARNVHSDLNPLSAAIRDGSTLVVAHSSPAQKEKTPFGALFFLCRREDSPSTNFLPSQKFVWALARSLASLLDTAPPF